MNKRKRKRTLIIISVTIRDRIQQMTGPYFLPLKLSRDLLNEIRRKKILIYQQQLSTGKLPYIEKRRNKKKS